MNSSVTRSLKLIFTTIHYPLITNHCSMARQTRRYRAQGVKPWMGGRLFSGTRELVPFPLTPNPQSLTPASFVAQRYHRIHLCRAPRWDVARQSSGCQHREDSAGNRDRVGGLDTEKHALKQPLGSGGERDSDQHTQRGHCECFAQDHAEHVAWLSAQGEADSKLFGPP